MKKVNKMKFEKLLILLSISILELKYKISLLNKLMFKVWSIWINWNLFILI